MFVSDSVYVRVCSIMTHRREVFFHRPRSRCRRFVNGFHLPSPITKHRRRWRYKCGSPRRRFWCLHTHALLLHRIHYYDFDKSTDRRVSDGRGQWVRGRRNLTCRDEWCTRPISYRRLKQTDVLTANLSRALTAMSWGRAWKTRRE